VHIPVPTPAEIAAALKRAAEIAWEATKAAAAAAAKLACDGLKAAANLALTVAQKFLDGVLLLHAAAFAVMKALASALTSVLLIDYVSIEAELSSNILQSYIGGTLQFTIGGKQFSFSMRINLSDLLSIVTDIFDKIVAYFKSLFPVEEATAMLQKANYSPDAVASLLRPENIYLVQMKLGHFNKGGARNVLKHLSRDDPENSEIIAEAEKVLAQNPDNQDRFDDVISEANDVETFDPTKVEENAAMRAEYDAEIVKQLTELEEAYTKIEDEIAKDQEMFLIQMKAKQEQLLQEEKAKVHKQFAGHKATKARESKGQANAAAYSDSAYERLLQRLDNMKNDDDMSTALLDLDSEATSKAKWGAVGSGLGSTLDALKTVGSAAVNIFNSGVCSVCLNQIAYVVFGPIKAANEALCAATAVPVAGLITGALVGADFGVLGTATGLLVGKTCVDAINTKALPWTKIKTYGNEFATSFCNFSTLCKNGK